MANEKIIWDKLIGAGLSTAGAAGLMGNLKAESNLEPKNLQNTYERKLGYNDESYTAAVDSGKYTNFAHDAAGYGLAQWTYHTRKAALLAFAKERGASIGDLGMQLDFLLKELQEDYKAVWVALCMAQNVRGASDVVLLQFERPADTSENVRKLRASFGEKFLSELSGEKNTPGEGVPSGEEVLPNPPMPEQETSSGTPQEIITGELCIGGTWFDVTGVRRG